MSCWSDEMFGSFTASVSTRLLFVCTMSDRIAARALLQPAQAFQGLAANCWHTICSRLRGSSPHFPANHLAVLMFSTNTVLMQLISFFTISLDFAYRSQKYKNILIITRGRGNKGCTLPRPLPPSPVRETCDTPSARGPCAS